MNYLDYFKEIAKIPHGSGNIEAICRYLVDFAKNNGYYYRQDELGNVVIIREAHPDYADHDPIILQGHMDMVAVKEEECDKDMKKEGLDLVEEDDFLYAKGTSLGGDDGIALAYALDILSGNYKTPRIEAIFTVDEETGMYGAYGLDVSDITAKKMISLDQEEEGIFVVSCAGGTHMDIQFPMDMEVVSGPIYRITVSNLKSGHSGVDIDKKRGNAIKILFSELCKLSQKVDFSLVTVSGGDADNAIPKQCYADIMLTNDTNPVFASEIKKLNGEELYFGTEDDIDTAIITVTEKPENQMFAGTLEFTKYFIEFMNKCPDGIVAMQEADPNAVETSLNIGMIRTGEEDINISILARSRNDVSRNVLSNELCKLAKEYGGLTEITGSYPGWAYRKDSVVRDIFAAKYEELFGNKPVIEAIHAGLECGIFASKIEDLDCISIGPSIDDIHTYKEKLSLSSAKRCFDLLVAALEAM